MKGVFVKVIDGGFLLVGSCREEFDGDNSSVCSKFSVLPDTCPQDSMNGIKSCLHDFKSEIMSESLDRRHDPFGYLLSSMHSI